MKHKLKIYCGYLLCSFMIFSCTYRPKGVISQQKMEETLYDVYLAQALIQASTRYTLPESKDSLLSGVLAKHEITQAQFDSSIVWYSTQGEVYFKINDRVSKRLKDLLNEVSMDESLDLKLRKKYDGYTLPPSVLLGGRGCTSAFGFEIDSLKFGQIDTVGFDFNFKTLGVIANTKAYVSIRFEYKDTTIITKRELSQNTYYSFKKPQNVKHKLRKISGYIYVDNPTKLIPPIYVYDLKYKKIIPKPQLKPVEENSWSKNSANKTH